MKRTTIYISVRFYLNVGGKVGGKIVGLVILGMRVELGIIYEKLFSLLFKEVVFIEKLPSVAFSEEFDGKF